MNAFKINGEFTVIPEKNLINDVRLEPRLIKLLCLLIKNPGNVVNRDQIISEVWNGYPGGDEGLTQGISLLRKTLNDTEKKIIETITKAGYAFNGEVEEIRNSSETANPILLKKADNLAIILLITAIITIALIVFYFNRANNQQPLAPEAKGTGLDNQSPGIAPSPAK